MFKESWAVNNEIARNLYSQYNEMKAQEIYNPIIMKSQVAIYTQFTSKEITGSNYILNSQAKKLQV